MLIVMLRVSKYRLFPGHRWVCATADTEAGGTLLQLCHQKSLHFFRVSPISSKVSNSKTKFWHRVPVVEFKGSTAMNNLSSECPQNAGQYRAQMG
jgi:hypothetical protein